MHQRSVALLPLALFPGLVSQLNAGSPPVASQSDPPFYKTHAREVVADVMATKGSDVFAP